MSLDTSGAILEGIRLAPSSNVYVYPPRDLVLSSDISAFNAVSRRSEYCIFVSGQSLTSNGIGISDPNLRFFWTRNDSVFRFDYDNYSKRWFPAPGSSPINLGTLTNSPRITAPIPSVSDFPVAPYQVYVGLPRVVSLTVSVVSDSSFFGNPPAGTVEISLSDGLMNFSSFDISNPSYSGLSVYVSRQSFYDRSRNNGNIGSVKTGSFLYLNPIPAPGQHPLIRIGYGRYLKPTSFPVESSMPVPSSLTDVHFSLDTGRVLVSPSHAGSSVYYDGLAVGSAAVSLSVLGTVVKSISYVAVGSVPDTSDSSRYVFFITKPDGSEYYLTPSYVNSISSIRTNTVQILKSTGEVFLSIFDSYHFNGMTLTSIDTYLKIEDGVTFQVYRSALNGPGVPVVPDFVEYYSVNGQVIVNGFQSSPFVPLPVRLTSDSSTSFNVEAGSGGGGGFVGALSRAEDQSGIGNGYLLDLDQKRAIITYRKSYSKTIERPSSVVKLDDGAIIEQGFSIEVNGVTRVPGVDFSFDFSSGLIEFLKPIGELDPKNKYGISGSVQPVTGIGLLTGSGPNIFKSDSDSFSVNDIGSYIFIKSGPNIGLRKIVSYTGPNTVEVTPSFISAGSCVADVRASCEILAERFWRVINPDVRDFKIETSDSVDGVFQILSTSLYSVSPNLGQVNLVNLSEPGKVYRVSYTSLDSNDNGVTSTPTSRVEFAPFKVRLEAATFIPGQNIVHFNSSNKTVIPGSGITVIVDGVTIEPQYVEYVAPNSAVIGTSIKEGQEVLVSYFVAESPGGNKTIGLSHYPVKVDYTSFESGSNSVILNGDFSDLISGCCVKYDEKYALVVSSSSYSSSQDTTTISFTTPVQQDFTGSFKSCDSLSFISASSIADTIPDGSVHIQINGSYPIVSGSIVTVDGDPYIVSASSYSLASGKTYLTIESGAIRSYISGVIQYSSVPVFEPRTDFQTSEPLNGSSPLTIFRGGTSPKILSKSDYVVSDGGAITLSSPIGYGDYLQIMYVAKSIQPAGTIFTVNYSRFSSPDQSNGLVGQRLTASYNLFSPDSFYYRVETVESYMTDLTDAIKSQSSSSSSSGPSIGDATSLQNKDYGIPSLYFNEQKYWNLDYEVQILLRYYNDLINYFEDLRSNLNGNAVGGSSGKFRYDGNLNNSSRNSYSEITNDIDDRIKVSESFVLSGFFTYSVVNQYQGMWETGPLSRLFPTRVESRSFINSLTSTSNYGAVIGSVGVSNVTSLSTFTNAPSSSHFETYLSPTVIKILKNGDPEGLVPPFVAGQKVNLYSDDGSLSGTANVVSVTPSSGYFLITLSSPSTISFGSVSSDVVDDSVSVNKFYVPNVDIGLDSSTGSLKNISLSSSISSGRQVIVSPNSIISSTADFQNFSTSPKRIPALDGSPLNDSGYPSNPLLSYSNEISLLREELSILNDSQKSGTALVQSDLVTVSGSTMAVAVGDQVMFVGGPNDGAVRTVSTVISVSSFQVYTPFLSANPTQSVLTKVSFNRSYKDVLSDILNVVNSNAESAPVPPAIIGTLKSEMKLLTDIGNEVGNVKHQGIGNTSGSVLTDVSASFSFSQNTYVLISDGPNFGFYKVISSTPTSITVDIPFPSSSSVQYKLISRYSFLSDSIPTFLSENMGKTYSFYSSTYSWASSLDPSVIDSRKSVINDRLSYVENVELNSLANTLESGDSLYSRRFLWIQQRADRKQGFMTKARNAATVRTEEAQSLVESQQKAYQIANM